MASSKSVVIAALIANGLIAILKFIGFILTQSPSMLSEAYHSVSDTGNQVFLLIGIRYGRSRRTEEHPFGRGKAQFFYSFLVSVLLFGIAGWASARHGFEAIRASGGHSGGVMSGTASLAGFTFPSVWVNYGVLIGAFIFETYALLKAYQGMRKSQTDNNWDSLLETAKKTSNVATLTAFTEDLLALAGVTLAFIGILLTQTLGNPIFDAISSFVIGLLLMSFAVALAWQNKRLLLGESVDKQRETAMRGTIMSDESVVGIHDFRTVFFGPNRILLTAEVEFKQGTDVEQAVDDVEQQLADEYEDLIRIYIEPENDPSDDVNLGEAKNDDTKDGHQADDPNNNTTGNADEAADSDDTEDTPSNNS